MAIRIFALICFISLFGCTSTKKIASKNIDATTRDLLHSALADYDLLEITGQVKTKGYPTTNILIRIQKDHKIWARAKSFGFEIGRGLITQDSVYYMNRLTKDAYVGDYDFISQKLGQEINYQLVQAILLDEKILPDFQIVSNYTKDQRQYVEVSDRTNDLIHVYDLSKKQWSESIVRRKGYDYELEVIYDAYKLFLETVNYPYLRQYIIKKDNIKETEFELIIQNIRILDEISTPLSIPSHYSLIE